MTTHPSTGFRFKEHSPDCPATDDEIISFAGHQACEVCEWHTPGFEDISFADDSGGSVVLGIIAGLQHLGNIEYFRKQELRARIERFQNRLRKKQVAAPSGDASTNLQIVREVQVSKDEPEIPTTPPPSPNIETLKPLDGIFPKPSSAGRKRSTFKALLWEKIQKVYSKNPNLEGVQFWKNVELENGAPDPEWRLKGCPKNLSEAFKDPKWRGKLNREKANATRELRQNRHD